MFLDGSKFKQTIFKKGHLYGIIFCEQFLKRTSQETFLPSLVQISPAVWEEKMFKEIVDDGHSTTLKAPFEHIVLRWAKNPSDHDTAKV